MTEEEMSAAADRALVRYARNERAIRCLLSRLADIGRALSALPAAADSGAAEKMIDDARMAVSDYDLKKALASLNSALQERSHLEKEMKDYGVHAHMIQRR